MNTDVSYPGGAVRLFIEQPLGEGERVTLSAPQSHYLLHVMRAKSGDRLRLFNGCDGEWLAALEAGRRSAVAMCERKIALQADVSDVWLIFAPIKRTPSDYVAQKATELGVRVLQPVITRRTIASRVNLERMRANAIEAAEQSGRVTVPEVRTPLALSKLLKEWQPGRTLIFCDEARDAKPMAEALACATDGACAILTGPEGGFDSDERELIRASAFVVPVTLGKRVLRADTAALAALAVWQSVKGEWRE